MYNFWTIKVQLFYNLISLASKKPPEAVLKFRSDVALLISSGEHQHQEIAEKLGIGKTHLSHCLNKKNPGVKLRRKFYEIFGNDLKRLSTPSPSSPQKIPVQDDLIHTYNIDLPSILKEIKNALADITQRQDQQDQNIKALTELIKGSPPANKPDSSNE